MRTRTPAALAIVAALALAACRSDDEMAAAVGDVTVLASERDDLSTFVAAIEAAGLLETLQGDGPFVSLAGNELPVTVDGDTITIGGAEIVEADIFATNEVIHVIDTVLAPN